RGVTLVRGSRESKSLQAADRRTLVGGRRRDARVGGGAPARGPARAAPRTGALAGGVHRHAARLLALRGGAARALRTRARAQRGSGSGRSSAFLAAPLDQRAARDADRDPAQPRRRALAVGARLRRRAGALAAAAAALLDAPPRRRMLDPADRRGLDAVGVPRLGRPDRRGDAGGGHLRRGGALR